MQRGRKEENHDCKPSVNQIFDGTFLSANQLQLHVAGPCASLFICEDSESVGLHITH